MDCKLKTFLNCTHPKGHFVPFQKHEYHEIVFYKSGKGQTTVNGEMFEYSENSMVLIPSNTEHDEVSFEPTEVFFCLFECNKIKKLSGGQLYKCEDDLAADITDSFLRIKEEYSRGYANTDQMLNHLMSQLLIQAIRASDSTKLQDDEVRHVRTYIKEYCAQKINYEILAESIGYSHSRMRHLFKEQYGQSMLQYQINSKINMAKIMLENTEILISEVGVNCGFNSTSRFIEMFKKRCGLTPQKYRVIMKNPHDETLTIGKTVS